MKPAFLILQLLLLFLVRLSLRMRVDRFDGVGKLLWADETVVNATVTGFLAALARKPPSLGLPETPLICFDYFFSRCSEADLHEITREVAAACPDGHPEKTLLSQNASAHAAQLFTALSRLLNARD